jgi:putative membrane protein
MNDFWELFIKGIPIGMSNTLPGISGGTMALVLKIYERLIKGIKKIQLMVLIPIIFGAVTGVFATSKLIINLIDIYPGFFFSFLVGLILASSKVTAAEVEEVDLKTVVLAVVGFLFAFLYSTEVNIAASGAEIPLIRYFIGGTVGSVAMILPGISGGTILVMLGLYQGVLSAISSLNFPIIIVFGLGVGVGLLVFSWILSYFLNNFRSSLMAFLTGLILGSLRSVIPSSFEIITIVGFLTGIYVIFLLDRVET